LFRTGDLSPVAAAEECLDLVAQRDGAVHAFLTLTPEVAAEAASRSEERWRRGEPRSPLDGVPVAIKDLTSTAGVRTTFGSRLFADHVPDGDTHYWARLKEAGAVLIGKTNTPELGGLPTTENLLGPPTVNPWDHRRTAGGSSGGAAAALALGMVPLAEGSDGAGSIRIPASCCGVVGIKPSRGRVSEGPLFGEQMGGFATSGPMATTVPDALLMLHVMEGADAGDPYPWVGPRQPRPIRLVGVLEQSPHAPVDPDVRAAVDRVARDIESLGYAVEPADLPLDGFAEPWVTIWGVGMAATPIRDPEQMEARVRHQYESGRDTTGWRYERARVRAHRLSRALRVAMEPYDAVVMPVLTTPPKALGWFEPEDTFAAIGEWLAYTYPFNLSGQPSVAVPGGTSAEGLPVGVQFAGRFGEDETVAGLAALWEASRGLPHPHPPLQSKT
jgi:amidase